MVGLVWIDTLRLTPAQWGAVVGYSAGWLYVWHRRISPGLASAVLLCGLLVAFWNVSLCTDTHMLFDRAAFLRPFAWPRFLAELGQQPYIRRQPPFVTFAISRLPHLGVQQALWLPAAWMTIQALFILYGPRAALVCATPLWALSVMQPGNDLLLVYVLTGVLLGLRAGRPLTAALLYGLCWWVKPLVLVTLPVIAPRLRVWVLLSIALWGLYYLWARQWVFGHHQWIFLQQQLLLR